MSDGFRDMAASLNPRPGDRDRIQPPAAKPKTRTTRFLHNHLCPDCLSLLQIHGDPIKPDYMACHSSICPSHGTRYKVPTIELEIINERQSSLPTAAPVDADAGAAPSPVEMPTSDLAANREEILQAFAAKHGLEPDEVEQVTIWSVRKKQREAKP